jgi:hypothetical protein
MKRFVTAALLAALCSTTGLVGCSEKSQIKEKETVSTPGGQTTTETTKEIKSSGENPPPNTAGQTAETPK